jgi:hypothetical protein
MTIIRAISAPAVLGLAALLAGCGASGSTGASPAVTRTDFVTRPGPAVTVTETAQPAVAAGPGTTMSADGVYVVGTDIRHGVYHTTGAVGGSGGDCYVALLSSTNTNSIIDNNNVTGPDTITVGPGVRAVEVTGCNTWHRL